MFDMIKALNTITAKINEEIEYVNSGGCCVFASIAYPYLKKLGLKPKIRVSDRWVGRKTLGNIRKMINTNNTREWSINGIHFSHVLNEIEYNGVKYFFDSKGVVRRDSDIEPFCNGIIHRGQLKHVEAVTLAADATAWNKRFYRGQIPDIERILEDGFKKLFLKVGKYA